MSAKYKDEWWGMGIEAGIDSLWKLGMGFGVFADLGTAILYGNHNMRFKETNNPAFADDSNSGTSLPNGVFANVKARHNPIAHPVLDLQLGLCWDWLNSAETFGLALKAGWENHVYFSQNQLPIFGDDFNYGKFFANQGDLTLQGWTFGARFDF